MTGARDSWLGRRMGRRKPLWAFDDEERGVLVEAAVGIPVLQSILARGPSGERSWAAFGWYRRA